MCMCYTVHRVPIRETEGGDVHSLGIDCVTSTLNMFVWAMRVAAGGAAHFVDGVRVRSDIFQKGQLLSPPERQRCRHDRGHLRLAAAVTLGANLQPLNLQGHFSVAEDRNPGGKNERNVSPAGAAAAAAAQQHCLCECVHTVSLCPRGSKHYC